MNWLELKYVNLVSGRLKHFKRINDRTYQFSCPLCGDGKTGKRSRGYIYEKKGEPRFHCHNCGRDMKLHNFFREVDPQLYNEYKLERITSGIWVPGARVSLPEQVKPKEKQPVISSGTQRSSPLDVLTKVSDLPPEHRARKLVESRQIPEEHWSRLYHCPRFYAWCNYVLPEKIDEKALKHDEARLVIPFFDKNGRCFAFQGRSYKSDATAKYITIRIDESNPKIFGLDRVDRSKTVQILEGPIDALFCTNGVAFAGGSVGQSAKHLQDRGFDKLVVVYDNEPRSIHTKKKMLKAVEEGLPVCVWPSYIKEKDINDMIVKGGMTAKQVEQIIQDNTFQGLAATFQINKWSRQ